jgi:hypothetical protein
MKPSLRERDGAGLGAHGLTQTRRPEQRFPVHGSSSAHLKPGPTRLSQWESISHMGGPVGLQMPPEVQKQLPSSMRPHWQAELSGGQPASLHVGSGEPHNPAVKSRHVGEAWANAGLVMLVRTGADHTSALPAPIRLIISRRETDPLAELSSLDMSPP